MEPRLIHLMQGGPVPCRAGPKKNGPGQKKNGPCRARKKWPEKNPAFFAPDRDFNKKILIFLLLAVFFIKKILNFLLLAMFLSKKSSIFYFWLCFYQKNQLFLLLVVILLKKYTFLGFGRPRPWFFPQFLILLAENPDPRFLIRNFLFHRGGCSAPGMLGARLDMIGRRLGDVWSTMPAQSC